MKESKDNPTKKYEPNLSFGDAILRFFFILLLVLALPIYMVVRVTGNLIKSLKSKDA